MLLAGRVISQSASEVEYKLETYCRPFLSQCVGDAATEAVPSFIFVYIQIQVAKFKLNIQFAKLNGFKIHEIR